mmetsp:Transcript_9074/g.13943  ORF Transcript_9074/g.13943 Transcript_9074/m.13943 type:complete len:205 (+) Transcript_9074:762-1376(+)
MPRALAIWITAMPTMLLAPFWMITSPSPSSWKSRSRRKAVQGLTERQAAYSAGRLGGTFRKSAAAPVAACRQVPNPGLAGITQSPTDRSLTAEPTPVTLATPSFPPTAGSEGRISYDPSTMLRSEGLMGAAIICTAMSVAPRLVRFTSSDSIARHCVGCPRFEYFTTAELADLVANFARLQTEPLDTFEATKLLIWNSAVAIII